MSQFLGYTFKLIIISIVGISCTTMDPKGAISSYHLATLKSYPRGLASLNNNEQSRFAEWNSRYKSARKKQNKLDACNDFIELQKSTDWPLAEVAGMRALDACDNEKVKLEPPDVHEAKLSSSFHPELAKIAVKKAKTLNNPELEMIWTARLAPFSPDRLEQARRWQRALELARSLKLEEKAKDYRQKLLAIAPRFLPTPTPADYMKVAHDHRIARNFAEAKKYYQLILSDKKRSNDEILEAFKSLIRIYKIEGNKEQYLAKLKSLTDRLEAQLLSYKKKPAHIVEQYHESILLYMRAVWTEDQNSLARALLDRAEKNVGTERSKDQIHWLRARMMEEAGDWEGALKELTRGLSEKPTAAQAEVLYWTKAWMEKKLARLDDSEQTFRQLLNLNISPFAKVKYQYWLAQVLRAKSNSEADTLLRQLATDDAIGYYGILARRDLKLGISKPAATSTSPALLTAPEKFNPLLFESLLDVEEVELARQYLLRSYPFDNPEDMTALSYYARAGLYHTVFTRFGQMTPEQRTKFLAGHFEFVFPTPYIDYFVDTEKKFGVESALMLAISRQESSFDPYARSGADAFGVMQLLPEVASRVAKESGLSYSKAEDLFNPEVNIPLGGYFLKMLQSRFDNQFMITVASYNANERAVMGWIKTRYRGDSLEFIEDIPYEETKTYIKLVLRNYIFYQLLLSGKSEVEFPEWTLRLNQ